LMCFICLVGSWFSSLGGSATTDSNPDNNDTKTSDSANASSEKKHQESDVSGRDRRVEPKKEGDFADLQQAFLAALELDSVETSNDNDATLKLTLPDQGVLLNSLATAVISIQALRNMVSGYAVSGDVEVSPLMPSLVIIVEEIDRCYSIYDSLLMAEINALERDYMLATIDSSIKKLLLEHPSKHSNLVSVPAGPVDRAVYEMSGDEVDRLQTVSSVNPLVECVRALFAWTQEDVDNVIGSSSNSRRAPNSHTSEVVVSVSRRADALDDDVEMLSRKEGQWRRHASRAAVERVLSCVATTINDAVMHVILGTTVETGGAMSKYIIWRINLAGEYKFCGVCLCSCVRSSVRTVVPHGWGRRFI
jgi:hypothetical protein